MPISLDPNFKEFLESLNSAKVEYLLLGGYAVNYHGYHRFTGDLDVWIALKPKNAQRLTEMLRAFGLIDEHVTAETFLQVGKVFQFGRVPVRIDLLTTPSGIEFDECYRRRVTPVLDGVPVPLLSLMDLRANKMASGRLKDLADLENLPTEQIRQANTERARGRTPRRKRK